MSQIRRRMAETMNYEQCTKNYEHRPPHKPPIQPNLSINYDINYAKQTQFPKSSNERIYLLYKGLSNFFPLAGYKNKPNSNPIKPNFRKNEFKLLRSRCNCRELYVSCFLTGGDYWRRLKRRLQVFERSSSLWAPAWSWQRWP